jgi:IclR family KDG regulon transcriptional repressor
VKIAGGEIPLQTVVRAFSILEALAESPAGVRLIDLSRKVGLHKSTAFRLVRTMALLGYVAQTEDGKLYRIGDGVRLKAERPSS